MNKRAIVNVATGDFYCKMQERLERSIQKSVDKIRVFGHDLSETLDIRATRWGIDCLLWRNILPEDSPTHEQSPYGFKSHAFKAAYEAGYNSILWVDSPIVSVKEDVSPIFEKIEKEGYYAMSHIDPLENWVGDTALTAYQWPREKLMGYNLPSGSCYGFRIDGPMPTDPFGDRELFWGFYLQEQDGLFKSEVIGEGKWHRHDEAILAMCLIERGLPIFSFDPLFQGDSPECIIKSGGWL